MLKGITWGEFFSTLLIIGAFYYTVVLLLYYRRDIINRLRGKKAPRATTPTPGAIQEADDAFAQASAFKKEVNDILQDAKDSAWIKQEILMALAGRAQSYPAIKGTAFQPAIENHILQQTPLITHIILDAEEVKRIW